jgi:hypothetical protein
MDDDELFSSAHHREKVQCVICGRSGYPGGSWQVACRRGHPWSCSCGRRFNGLAGIAGHLRQAGQDHFTVSRPTTGR